jgi:3-methyladenine DNA glycosylase AlkD
MKVPESNAALVEEVCRVLASAGDPERAEAQRRYMKSAMSFHGISAAQLRAILRPVLADPAYRIDRREEWEATVRVLWDGATHREIRYAAIALTGHRAYRLWQDPQTLGLYQHLITTGAWWDLVDVVAANRVGPILRVYPAQTAPRVRQWAVSDDVWLRRAAIISQLGAKASTDVGLLDECLEANLEGSTFGSQFWVRKAVGWALRQHARTDADWVRQAVARYGNRLSGLSRREALKHVSALGEPAPGPPPDRSPGRGTGLPAGPPGPTPPPGGTT